GTFQAVFRPAADPFHGIRHGNAPSSMSGLVAHNARNILPETGSNVVGIVVGCGHEWIQAASAWSRHIVAGPDRAAQRLVVTLCFRRMGRDRSPTLPDIPRPCPDLPRGKRRDARVRLATGLSITPIGL